MEKKKKNHRTHLNWGESGQRGGGKGGGKAPLPERLRTISEEEEREGTREGIEHISPALAVPEEKKGEGKGGSPGLELNYEFD